MCEMNEALKEMARKRYGYGRWDAPYWFIGPEEGMAQAENNDLTYRLNAWHRQGSPEVCDCQQFSRDIGVAGVDRWFRDINPPLQKTWKCLMRLLMTFLNRPADNDCLRDYQRSRWGSTDSKMGETCVIELSGLAANNLGVPRERTLFRSERIDHIRKMISDNQPRFVVMYGVGERESWEKIAGRIFPPDGIISGSTILVLTPHPESRGLTNSHWEELGRRLANSCANGTAEVRAIP